MFIWIVKFPKNFFPREIAYKEFGQAWKIMKKYNIPLTRKYLTSIYLEEDKNAESFS
jgi:hypothetical protein